MSKKRKLEGSTPEPSARRITSQRPLSAFEAARARSIQTPVETSYATDIGDSEASIYEQPSLDDVSYITSEPANGPEEEFSTQENWRQMSTWTPSSGNVLHSDGISSTLRLRHLERIANVGSFNLRVIKGRVSMCGADLSPQDPLQTIYACGTHPLPVIVCSSASGADIIISNCSPPLQGLGALSPLFRGLWNWSGIDGAFQAPTFSRIDNSRQDQLRRPLVPLVVSDEWDSTLAKICPATSKALDQIIVVAGMKRVGKSTFSKLLVNRFLSTTRNRPGRNAGDPQSKDVPAAFLLDINPGIPGLALPGQISLVKLTELITSPPYATAPSGQIVLRSHPLPDAAVHDSNYYLDCISDLIFHYQSHLGARVSKKSPLIIDTVTWSSLSDGDFYTRLFQRISPTHLVYLGLNAVESIRDRFKRFGFPSQASFHTLTGHTVGHVSRSDQQLQDMQLLSHFHREPAVDPEMSWNTRPLIDSQPISVSYSRDCPGFSGILLSSWTPPEYLATVIDGSVLSVVYSEDPLLSTISGTVAISEPDKLPYFQQNENGQLQQLDPARSHLVCLVLVVKVDTENQVMDVIVPPTQEKLLQSLKPQNIALVHGCIRTPTWAFKESIYMEQCTRFERADRLSRGEDGAKTLDLVREQCHREIKRMPWLETRDVSSKAFWGKISTESGLEQAQIPP